MTGNVGPVPSKKEPPYRVIGWVLTESGGLSIEITPHPRHGSLYADHPLNERYSAILYQWFPRLKPLLSG